VHATFEPCAENRGLYDHLFRQFQASYAALRPVFNSLNAPGAPSA
jgi:hypothetical protein